MLTAQDAQDYARWQDQQNLALQQAQAMIAQGVRPSDEMLGQAGLSKEYLDAILPENAGAGTGWDPLQDAIRAYWANKDGNGQADGSADGYTLQNYDGVYADANEMLAARRTYSEIANLVSSSSLTQTEKDEILSDIRNQTGILNPKKGNGGR